jgi:hypothetical protein
LQGSGRPDPEVSAAIMPDQSDDTPVQLPNHKVKYKKPLQRACNEKNDKGKFCGGHLKRWYYTADVVEQGCGDVLQAFGDNGEVYRCEHCKTLYLPTAEEPRGKNVAGVGKLSIFGVTVVPKAPPAPGSLAAEEKQ